MAPTCYWIRLAAVGGGSGNAKQHHSVQLIGFQCVRTQACVLVVEVCSCGFSLVEGSLQVVGVVEQVCELGVEWLQGFGGADEAEHARVTVELDAVGGDVCLSK